MICVLLGFVVFVLLGVCDGEINWLLFLFSVLDSGSRADIGVMDMDVMVLLDGVLPDGAFLDGVIGMDGVILMDGVMMGDGVIMDVVMLLDGVLIDVSDFMDSGFFDPGDSLIDFCSMVILGMFCVSGVDCVVDEVCIANGCG